MLSRLAGLARQSRLHDKFPAQLAGLKFFHVIAKLIFIVFHRRAEILANRTSPAKRASPLHVIGPLGAHYMSRADPVSRAGSVYRDDCSARYYMHMRRASPPAAKFRSRRVKRWLTSKSMNQVFLFSPIHYFGVLFSVLRSFMVR